MAICIKCGWNCEPLSIGLPFQNTGWKCVNPDCEIYNQPWTLAEHKDSQEWAVRHIRNSEDEIAYLKTIIAAQQNQIVDLATQFKDFKEGLAKALGVDINTL